MYLSSAVLEKETLKLSWMGLESRTMRFLDPHHSCSAQQVCVYLQNCPGVTHLPLPNDLCIFVIFFSSLEKYFLCIPSGANPASAEGHPAGVGVGA